MNIQFESKLEDPNVVQRLGPPILLSIVSLPFWPYLVVMIINHSFFFKDSKFKEFLLNAGQWILATILVLVVLALLNSKLLS